MCQSFTVITFWPFVWYKPWTWFRHRMKPCVLDFTADGSLTFKTITDKVDVVESDPRAVIEAVNNAPGFDLITELFSPKLKEKE